MVEPVAGNMGVVAPQPGFLEALREETARVGALLIFDEVMTGFRVGLGRRAGTLRDHARSDVPGEGRRRRHAAGGVRWSSRSDAADRARRAGLPGRHAVRESARGDRRPRHAARACSGCRTPTSASTTLGARAEAGLRDALSRPTRGAASTGSGRCSRSSWGSSTSATSPPRSAPTSRAFARFFQGMLGRGHLPAAVAVRGDVPVAGAHRGRHRPVDRRHAPGPGGGGLKVAIPEIRWTRYARGVMPSRSSSPARSSAGRSSGGGSMVGSAPLPTALSR